MFHSQKILFLKNNYLTREDHIILKGQRFNYVNFQETIMKKLEILFLKKNFDSLNH